MSHNRHEPHSKTLPAIDLSSTPWSLATANPLSITNLTNLNNFVTITPPAHDLNYSLDVNEHEHISDTSTEFSQSDANHFQSYYQSPHDRSSPSSLLLPQLTLPNLPLPSLNLNDSKTTEEDVLCALDPSPRSTLSDDLSLTNNKPKLKLLREAAKSEPPYPASYYQPISNRNHTKNSKSLHIKHITSQPPPMPTYYIHSRPHTHSAITSMSVKSKKVQQQQQQKKHHNHTRNRVHFDKSVTPKPKLSASNLNLIPSKSHEVSSSKKNKVKKKIKRSETPQPVYNNKNNKKNQVRVMRDQEVLTIDQEIPIEKFISALKKGYARIMTQDQQNEEYNKSARIARSVSVGNMQAYKDEILAAAQQEKRNRNHRNQRNKKNKKYKKNKYTSQSNKNTPKKYKSEHKKNKFAYKNKFEFNIQLAKAIPPKLLQGVENNSGSDTESISGSSSLDLLDPPKEIETAQDMVVKPSKRKMKIKIKRSIKRSTTGGNTCTNKGSRIRSKTTITNSASKNSNVKAKFPCIRTRPRPNGHYRASATGLVTQPSHNCPTSPSIPEEDDILDIDHMLVVSGDDAMSSHSGHSSCGFSSDSDSSSTDHDCEMPNPLKPNSKVSTDLPPVYSPSLSTSSKSCDALFSGLSCETKKFKIIKQTHNCNNSFESNNSDSQQDVLDSIENILHDISDDIKVGTEVYSDVDSDGIGSIGSGNHLTTSMYTKIEHNVITPLQLAIVDEMRQRSLSNEHKMRERALSNGSVVSNASSASSSSSFSSSSDWDEEVRVEEEEERHRKLNDGMDGDSDSDLSELATSSDSDTDGDGGGDDDEDALSLSLQQSNCTMVKSNENKNGNIPIRPQSTPFRSSKGTAVFLSHLKSYGSGKLSGNLNELINGVSRKCNLNKTEIKRKNKNMSQQNHSQIKPIKTIKPVTIKNDKYSTKFADNPNGYNSPQPVKMKKNKKKKFKAIKTIQKRKNNALSSKVNV